MLIIGFLLGFFAKLGFDEYHKFKNEQEKTASKMEDVLTRFKAIEMLQNTSYTQKNIDFNEKNDII